MIVPSTTSASVSATERDQSDRVTLLRLASAGTFLGCAAGLASAAAEGSLTWASVVSVVGSVVAGATWAFARSHTRLAAGAFVVLVTALITIVSAIYGNRYAGTASLYLLCVMLAGLLVSSRAALVTCGASVVGTVGLFVLDVSGRLPAIDPSPLKRASAVGISVVVATLVFTTALRRLRAARDDADQQARELTAMKASLETLVDERTRSLVEARDAAAGASRAKTAFLANMSHELRTPLNAIVGIAGLLREKPRPHDEIELLITVEQSTDALLAVLDDVLDLSRLEAGRFRIDKQACSPRAIVDEVVRFMQPEAARAGLTLDVVVGGDVPRQVHTDPTRLRQVLLNLVGNAVKFTAGFGNGGNGGNGVGGRVVVEAHANGRDVLRFDVVDTGCGISPQLQSRLFHPFVQGDASTTRRTGGSGLGLAICRQLVDLLGGDIDVESRPGHGARFTFTISAPDAAGAPLPPPAASLEVLSIPRAATLAVLVVEDNAVNRAVMELMLARLGIKPKSVDGGAAALKHLADHDVDVVLLDVQMPDIDGLEVARRVRAGLGPQRSRRPVLIAVTAHALAEEEARAKDAGVDDYLTKPVRLEVLAQAIARAVASSSSTQTAPPASLPAPSPEVS